MAISKKWWHDIVEVFFLFIFLGAVYFVVAYLFPDDWRIKWSLKYIVPFSHVTIEPRPTLCDWGHAPLGNKSCHYERVVSRKTVTLSTQGNPIVSYDGGETWKKPPIDYSEAELTELRLDRQRAEFVHISWERLEDP